MGWKFNLNFIEKSLSDWLRKLGRLHYRYPTYFILIPIIITIISSSFLYNVEYNDDIEYLYVPFNGDSIKETAIVSTLFPTNYSTFFNPSRSTVINKYVTAIVLSEDGGSVLRKRHFEEALELNREILNMEIFDEENISWTYQDICAQNDGECAENYVFELWKSIDEIENGTSNITYPLYVDPITSKKFYFGVNLGGVQVNMENTIMFSKAMIIYYYLNPAYTSLAEKWIYTIMNFIENKMNQHIVIYRQSSNTLREEMGCTGGIGITSFAIMLIIMFIFSFIACLMSDCVLSKPYLGVLGCISCILGVISGMAFSHIFGIEFIRPNLAIPFFLLGIGMDDTFVLLAAWRKTSSIKSVELRLSEAYGSAGVSITITSLTNFISFTIGATGPFNSMYIYCIYSASAVLFTYIYQITFFGGCMAVLGMAEKKNLNSLTFRPAVPKSLAVNRNKIYRFFCTGGSENPNGPTRPKGHLLMLFFRETMGCVFCKTYFKVIVILLYVLYLCYCIYGFTTVKEGFLRKYVFSYDSYVVKFFYALEEYFSEYRYRIQVVVNRTIDYSNKESRMFIEDMLKEFEALPLIGNSSYTESWLRSYLSIDNTTIDLIDKQQLIDRIRTILLLKTPSTKSFENDFLFNKDFTEILATRYVIQAVNISNSQHYKNLLISTREVAKKYDVTIFNPYFIYHDQYLIIISLTIQTIGTTALVMMVVTALFMPHIECVLWITFAILSIEFGILGYMSLWEVTLSSLSIMGLIQCIGYSVDYAAHITYAYTKCSSDDPNVKLKEALYLVGTPIVQSTVSTLLSIIVLAFIPSYIFLIIFKTWFLVMIFSFLHSLFVLPVLLSICNSNTCFNSKKNKMTSVEVVNSKTNKMTSVEVEHSSCI